MAPRLRGRRRDGCFSTANNVVTMDETPIAKQAGILLAAFAKELMVVRRHFRSYPKGHPVVEGAVGKAIDAYDRLIHHIGTVSLAIAKDHLLSEGLLLDNKNVFLRNLAQMFFRQGIGLVTLDPGLSSEELKRLLVLLELKREEMAEKGGIEAAWEQAEIASISIRCIRYDLFTASGNDDDVQAERLWERLARGLLEDSFSEEGTAGLVLDPELVAEILNGTLGKDQELDVEPVMRILQQEEQQLPGGRIPPSVYHKLASFVSRLSPDLRDQFLHSAVGALRPDGSSPLEDVLGAMPREAILNMLQEVNRNQPTMPPLLVGLLQKMAYGIASQSTASAVEDVMDKMSTIFTEHSSEQYTPDDYKRKLQNILTSRELPALSSDIGSLLSTLDAGAIELNLGDVILQLAVHGGEPEELERLAENMEEMCSCRLQTGDYHQVLEIIRRVDADQFPSNFRDRFRASITKDEFLEEILNGLSVWGKNGYPAIRELICTLGHPFIGPLLDKLAIEENISIRRFLIDRLVELGPQAKDEVVKRLDRGPWYYLRNLLIVLRSMDDASLAIHVRPLLSHQNETLRQEALRTLQHFGDAFAQRRIALDLDSSDRGIMLTALHVAGKTRSAEIFRKILALATQGGLSPAEVEVRCAAVRALGEIGAVAALPELIKVLHSSSLLRSKALARIKSEIIRSLSTYPHSKAVPLLKALIAENDNFSHEAAETLKALKEAP